MNMTRGQSGSSPAIFEALEDRKLFSDSGFFSSVTSQVSTQLSAATEKLKQAVAKKTAAQQSQPTPAPGSLKETIASLRYHAEIFGASKSALSRAIREAGKQKADSYDNALRLLIADGLALPKEALQSKLKAKELLDHVGNLNLIGSDDKPTSGSYWKGVIKNGAEKSLASEVANQLGIPPAAAKGKLAKELLQGAADINLVGGDARSLEAWKGLALVKAGKISVEQFADKYTHGKDVKEADQATSAAPVQNFTDVAADFDSRIGAAAPVNGNQNTTPVQNTQPAPSNPGNGAGDTTAQYITATLSGIQNNGDGSGTYTVTINYPDGSHETRQVTVNADGSSTIVHGDGSTESHPAGSTAMPSDDSEGQTYVVDQDTDGDGNNDSANTGSDDDDDDQDNQDDSSDDTSNDESSSDGSTDSGDESKGTPNPESITSNIRDGAEFYFNTKLGRTLVGDLIDPVKSKRGGGAIDPIEQGVSYANAGAFYAKFASPAFRDFAGNIDYPDDHAPKYIILDKRQLQALQIISGGAVGGPDIGKKPTAPVTGVGGVVPAPAPVPTGGVKIAFSQVRIAAEISLELTSTLRR